MNNIKAALVYLQYDNYNVAQEECICVAYEEFKGQTRRIGYGYHDTKGISSNEHTLCVEARRMSYEATKHCSQLRRVIHKRQKRMKTSFVGVFSF